MAAPSIRYILKKIPKNRKDFFVLLSTVFIFASIPLTIFVALNIRDNRSRAQEVPYFVLEEPLKKLDLTYESKSEKLVLKSKTTESKLPRKSEKKLGKADTKVLAIKVEQLNQFGSPIQNFVHEVQVTVNNKGEIQNKGFDFSVELPDKPGKAIFSLGEKKLLEVGL